MGYRNRITPDQLAALGVGQKVQFDTNKGQWGRLTQHHGTVTRLTPTQVVVGYTIRPDLDGEVRFRRDSGREVGGYGELLDPDHPDTAETWKRVQRERRVGRIESLAFRFRKTSNDLDVLRELHTAIGEHLDAES